jgi:hypothetical protein
MMRNVKTTMIASAIALSLGTANVLADSWTIVQEATISTATTLSQVGATDSSLQGINNINLNTTDGTVLGGSSQTVTISAGGATLSQDNATVDSNQAVNRISAYDVGDTTTAITQDVDVTAGNFVLGQNGEGNTQAINEAIAQNQLNKLEQDITASSSTLDMDQEDTTNERNIQAGNLIDVSSGASLSTTLDDVKQTINISTLNMDQTSTGESLQAGNALITADSGSATGTIKQSLTIGTLGITQTTTDGSIESGNYVGVTPW